uniref:BspA family leucine-rich repeat surface protein n=3 Tax=unclassified Prevotella TaxID=2638335 RepID=A0AB33J032_9BACT
MMMKLKSLRNLFATVVALFAMMFALPTLAQQPEAYVVKSDAGKTLTFYYDTQRGKHTSTAVYGINDTKIDKDGYSYPTWAGSLDNTNAITTLVVFDSSFKDYRPTTTVNWFACCTTLKQIKGMEYLNTSEVTDMNCMFFSCFSLISLNVSGFDTKKVTNMSEMFAACSSLSMLDLSHFNTSEVTDMYSMFSNCSALRSLNILGFETRKVTNMGFMFLNCSSLPTLNISHFNTENVTDMSFMFSNCSTLTTLDVSNFNTEKVENMTFMFAECPALTTIYCNSTWKCMKSIDMFQGSTKLQGAVGYNPFQLDVSMANPEYGYFKKKTSTGIETIQQLPADTHQPIYNLQGVRMNQTWEALPKGVYIVSGKKVVKK